MADLNMVKTLLRDLQFKLAGSEFDTEIALRVNQAIHEIEEANQNIKAFREEDRAEGLRLGYTSGQPYEFT